MIWVPNGGFGWKLSSQAGVRPTTTQYGHVVTPGNNTFVGAAWVELFTAAQMVTDAIRCFICINGNAVSTAARDTIVDIGIDTAGGTSYTVHIPNLLGSCAADMSRGGIQYLFPLRIPAGSSVAARASVNNATVGTLAVLMMVWGRPVIPMKFGSYCFAMGITAASSSGTAVTPGTTNEGAWTSLGTTSKPAWWHQVGLGINDATANTRTVALDLSYDSGGTKVILIEDEFAGTTAAEEVEKGLLGVGYEKPIASGVEVFGRAQCSSTLDSNYSMASWHVGG